MPGPWDDTLKMFISENPQDFASWLFVGAQVTGKLRTEFKKRTIDADALLDVIRAGERFLVHIEFQSTNDLNIGERLLEYSFEARREHKLPVYSCVIYLRDYGEVPQPPLRWEVANGLEVLQFHYRSIELGKIPTDELRRTRRVGLLPLLILTKGGATYDVVEEVIAELEAAEKPELLPITELLASLVFKNEADQEWIERTFAMLKDPLRDTPAYQRYLKEGRELGREEERQQTLERQRQTLLEIVQVRFPKLLHLTKGLATITSDPEVLERLIVKMGTAQTLEEAQEYLFEVDGSDKKN
jgi:predicted transposase YdaD